ncbi:iron-siderophore ABC transporter substrate-binding protein [Phormidium tenue FACHB-886]|nr:iron-siderophore ABC transporter substrate-binding protein [Phormidium tenue FACHB-886]
MLICIAFALVTACQNSGSHNLPVNRIGVTQSIESSASCRTVSHEMGKTEICGQPERVAALSPHILDSILALGKQPVAYAEVTALNLEKFDNPSQQIPYLGDRVTTQPVNLGDRKNPSLEKLALVKPDLILGENWTSQSQYELLSQIAPTLLFTDTKDNEQVWFHDIQPIARALDRAQEAEQLLVAHAEQLKAVRSQLKPVADAYPNVLILAINTLMNDVAIAADSTAGRLLEEIGFRLVFPEPAPAGETRWMQTSLELLPTLSADIVLVIAWNYSDPYNPKDQLKTKWNQNPILQNVPASQSGRVFFVDYQLWGSVTRGPITDELILKQLPEMLLPLLPNS